MLKSEFIEIKTKGCRKLPIFEKLGYDISGKFIKLKVKDLNIGSRELIDVICDYCNKDIKVTYKEYLRNISFNNKYACCKFCGSEKAKETNIEKYGVDYPLMLKEIQNKQKFTNLEKYGVEYLMQSKVMKDKSKKKILEKYGVDHISKVEIVRKLTSIISNDENYIKYNSNNESEIKCIVCSLIFLIKNDNYYHRYKNKLPLCTICHPIGKNNSIKEDLLLDYISSIYNGEIITGYRDGLEIDIYLPELKIGFEFNGLYWHSDEYKEKKYHLEKINHFLNNDGIRIIHIWEDDWDYKNEIIKSQIRNILNLNNLKIFARKCQIKEISDNKIIRKFLDENHIQGFVSSSVKIGLYHNDELVSMMIFDKNEGRKKMSNNEWNLSRFCNKLNTNVLGGASKLLLYFTRTYSPMRIISYADKSWSRGDLYYKLGFTKVLESNVDYKYIVKGKRIHKSRYRKSKLDTILTESQEMKVRNIKKIWDCGKIKFEKFIL